MQFQIGKMLESYMQKLHANGLVDMIEYPTHFAFCAKWVGNYESQPVATL
jgi:hypothetical protein